MSLDLAIRRGVVYDGTGSDAVPADVGIADGRIAAVGNVPQDAALELDATDLAVAPGFIDIHSHSDYTLLVDPRAVSAIRQGVTLEVVGNCGFGCFPIRDARQARRAIYGYRDEVPLAWHTAHEYFEAIERALPAVNVVSLVPNGQLRIAAGAADGPATPEARVVMAELLRESLRAGAWGFSSGLEYAQESWTTEDELVDLCACVAERGGLYATHTRKRDEGAADAVAEALRVATRARVSLQISHLVPRNGSDETRRCMELVEAARDGGLDVSFDMHTRTFGLTYLHAALPGLLLSLPDEQLATALQDAEVRRQVRSHRSIVNSGGWGRVVLFDNPTWPEYARNDIASIAAIRHQEPGDALCDLLLAGVGRLQELMVIINCYTPEQQRAAFAHPLCVPGSDATTLAPDGVLAESVFHGAYSWASWYWQFARIDAGLSSGEAIHRLTGAPAARLGLSDRGLLRVGACADVVVFDPERFRDRATVFEPNQPAEGVVHVIVNGRLTLHDGRLTGARGGTMLRRGRATAAGG
ncbi:MAG: N-acyl-D-amino-acid deacylase family protein [Candidatus Limnocylindrales bacterium]